MDGDIYTDAVCTTVGCGLRLENNGKDAMRCPDHRHRRKYEELALYVRFHGVFRRFRKYDDAAAFLVGLRHEMTKGTFDDRDYKKDAPLGFSTLMEQYLTKKEGKVDPDHLAHIKFDLRKRAGKYFQQMNIKQIKFAELEDFFDQVTDIGGKTRFNLRTNLAAFFRWCLNREYISQVPKFPIIEYVKGQRNTISKEAQTALIEEVRRITSHNPRIYIAIKWLSTYVDMRPGELHDILEEQIDFNRALLVIRNHKTAKKVGPKTIALLPEDIDELKSLPREIPGAKLHLFRWDMGAGRRYVNQPLGKNTLYTYWTEACANLGVIGVDLYGGTRHSTLQYLREIGESKEDVKELSDHQTNDALDHYIHASIAIKRRGYLLARASNLSNLPVNSDANVQKGDPAKSRPLHISCTSPFES